jgi:hypothetical protein
VLLLIAVCCLLLLFYRVYPLKSRISDICEPFLSYRDETERLIEIMWSRTPDLSFEDQRDPGSTANGFEKTPFSTHAKLSDPQSSWGPDILPPSNVRMPQLQYSTHYALVLFGSLQLQYSCWELEFIR